MEEKGAELSAAFKFSVDSAQNPNDNSTSNSASAAASCWRAFRILKLCLGHKLGRAGADSGFWILPRRPAPKKFCRTLHSPTYSAANSAQRANLILDSASAEKQAQNSDLQAAVTVWITALTRAEVDAASDSRILDFHFVARDGERPSS